MALGGGIFTTQNKVLPGAYINFVSLARATATLSDRGYAAMPLELDWGVDGEVFTVTQEDFQKNSKKIFGYEYTSEKLKGLRDLFLNASVLYAYRLNSGVKASNTFATAKNSGVRGNNLKIVITANIDESTKFDVKTYLDTTLVDSQTVSSAIGLVQNDYVSFKTNATLEATAGVNLAGGTNGTVTGESHQAFLDKIESYSFNTLGVLSTEETIKTLYASFTKRLRDDIGAKFQTVLYNKSADYEGVINLKNKIIDLDLESSLVYWVTGASAACAVNKSNLNKLYNGEFAIDTGYNQTQLANSIKAGEFTLHKVGDEIRVLSDINSLVTTTTEKGEDFKENQTIRVLDQIANDIAILFNTKYLGIVPNNKEGQVSLWVDLVKYYETLQTLGAIENFADDDVTVEQGDKKKSVVVSTNVTIVSAMAQLYMTVVVQ